MADALVCLNMLPPTTSPESQSSVSHISPLHYCRYINAQKKCVQAKQHTYEQRSHRSYNVPGYCSAVGSNRTHARISIVRARLTTSLGHPRNGSISHPGQHLLNSCNRQKVYRVKYGSIATIVGRQQLQKAYTLHSIFLVYCNYPIYLVQDVQYFRLHSCMIKLLLRSAPALEESVPRYLRPRRRPWPAFPIVMPT